MKVELLPSAFGQSSLQYFTTFLIDDCMAIDAGTLGCHGTPDDQAKIRHVFLTHSHIDHVAGLAVFLENVYQLVKPCVKVFGNAAVMECLRRDLFNDRFWPDFVRLSEIRPPFLDLQPLEPGVAVTVGDATVTPLPVNHPVPTFGYLVKKGGSAIAVLTDTGPTDAAWSVINSEPALKAVFLDLSFPDELAWLAEIAGHHTTGSFAAEAAKVKAGVPVYAIHVKPRYHDQVIGELNERKLPNVHVLTPGKAYQF